MGEGNALYMGNALWARRMRCRRGECSVGEANVLGSIHYRKVTFSARRMRCGRGSVC